MKIKVNGMSADIPVEPKDLIDELMKKIGDICWCNFKQDEKLYRKLIAKIRTRLAEPIDPGCID